MKKSLTIFLSLALILVVGLVITSNDGNSLAASAASGETVYESFDFESGIAGWTKYQDCKVNLVLEQGFAESNALAFNCSFNSSNAYSWDDAPIFMSPNIPSEVGGATHLLMDVYADSSFSTGGLNITPIVMSPQHTYWYMLTGVNIMNTEGTVVGNLKKYSLSFSLGELASTDIINYLTITTVGVNTNYSGKLYYDNIRFISYGEAEPAELSISQISVKNSWKLLKNEEISISCTATGGNAPYYYTYYALKDGKIHYKSDLRQSNPVATFILTEAGEYTLMAYCMDSGTGRTLCKQVTTMTVYNDESEIPEPKKLIALTFDDGPDASAGELLDTLKEKDAKATFFVWYGCAQSNGALVKRAYEEGHQIGNHTYSHTYMTQLTQQACIDEIEKTNDFIEQYTGIRPTIYRPPYFDYNSTVLSYFPNYAAIGCSIDSNDWTGISAEQIITNVVSKAQDGDIVLMHEPQANTRAAAGELIDRLREMGFDFVTVDELFARKGVEMQGAKYYSYVR